MKKSKLIALILIPVILVLLYKLIFLGTYFMPASISLGSCHLDWTTSQSYQTRSSPLKSTEKNIDSVKIKVCYGSPSARGRVLFGNGDSLDLVYNEGRNDLIHKKGAEVVTFNNYWRMGANEPTRIFLSDDILVENLKLKSGRYSVYAIPHSDKWDIFFSTSIFHWGNAITESVINKEVGSIKVKAITDSTIYSETLEFSFQEKADSSFLIMRWGNIKIPISVTSIIEKNHL